MFVRLIFLPLILLSALDLYSQKYDAEILKYHKTVDVEESVVRTDTHVELLINNPKGTEYGIVVISYSKNRQISDIDAHVEDLQGNILGKLKKSDILDRNEFNDSFYSDHFIKAFNLRHSHFPYKLVYNYTTTDKNYLEICDWSPAKISEIPTREGILKITLPNHFDYKIRTNKIDDTTIDSTLKSTLLIFNSSYLNPVKSEIYSNPVSELPRVQVLPSNFQNKYQGFWNTWQDYGNWICDLNEGRDVLSSEEKSKVDALIAGVNDKKEITRKLYHYLQDNTRYVSVNIGLGTLQPYPAQYVCQNKYGDCKALTIYMKALLKHAGITSYYTLINSSDQPTDFYYDFPSHQFNHAILMIPFENDTVWLENTNKHIACGYIPSSISNRPALVIERNNSRLVRTPAFDSMSVLNEEKQVYNLQLKGPSELIVSSTFRGKNFELLNSLEATASKEEFDNFIRKNMWFDNYEVLDWSIKKQSRETSEITLSARLSINKIINAIGSEYYITLPSIGIPSFTSPGNRTLPVYISSPSHLTDSLIYHLPDGLRLKSNYDPVEIQSSYGKYTIIITASDNTITIKREFQLFPGKWALSEYSALYNFIEKAKKTDKVKILVTPL